MHFYVLHCRITDPAFVIFQVNFISSISQYRTQVKKGEKVFKLLSNTWRLDSDADPYCQWGSGFGPGSGRATSMRISGDPGPEHWLQLCSYLKSSLVQVIRPFNLSPSNVGLIYGLRDGANSLFSPFWGWLCDRVPGTSVTNTDPLEPYIFRPPGSTSGSVSQRYGSVSFYNQVKK
jgi:hypothetical protein